MNRQMEGRGRHTFTYSIVPHQGSWREAGLCRLAKRLRTPAVVLWPGSGGALPPDHSLLRIDPANVSLSACYMEGATMLLRLVETGGIKTAATVILPTPPASVAAVALGGKAMPDTAVAIQGKTLHVGLCPWRIATLAITFPETENPSKSI